MADASPLELFETYAQMLKVVRATAESAYAEMGMGSAQGKFLRHIGKNRGISQAELARATRTAPTLTGRALEPLIAKGWIRRRRSEEDRREYILELTPTGERLRQKVEEARARLAERLSAILGDQDRADFLRIAKKVVAGLETSEAPAPIPPEPTRPRRIATRTRPRVRL